MARFTSGACFGACFARQRQAPESTQRLRPEVSGACFGACFFMRCRAPPCAPMRTPLLAGRGGHIGARGPIRWQVALDQIECRKSGGVIESDGVGLDGEPMPARPVRSTPLFFDSMMMFRQRETNVRNPRRAAAVLGLATVFLCFVAGGIWRTERALREARGKIAAGRDIAVTTRPGGAGAWSGYVKLGP